MSAVIQREEHLVIKAEAGSAAEAMQLLEEHKFNLVVSDVTLGGKSGLELVQDIKALYPDLPVLLLSMHDCTQDGPCFGSVVREQSLHD
ncbi:MAG: response regulator [Limisphaerales bacterium]